jgi:nitroimidazol reductase NimA-like FMN-containing flavoprotein (pyridoxamine 5'-phosphate oxidase superfamily)
VVEDRGYLDGECEHSFRSVQFRGTVTLIQGEDEKRRAVNLMIDHLESDPETVKARFTKPGALANVMLFRLHVEEMTAKQSPLPKGEG